MNKDNDPFRLPDPYDGVPADTIPPRPRDPSEDYDLRGEIVEPVIERAVYAVLTVWANQESDLHSYESGTKGQQLHRIEKWNSEEKRSQCYLVRIPVPAYVPTVK